MDEPTHDDLFLDAVGAIVLDALARIGNDARARFAFFKRLLAVRHVSPPPAGEGYMVRSGNADCTAATNWLRCQRRSRTEPEAQPSSRYARAKNTRSI
jgi:hypothetical protein